MFRMSLIALFCSALWLTSCASIRPVTAVKKAETKNTIAQRQLLIGTWRGEAPIVDGGTRTWAIQRNRDGTYRIDFKNSGVSGMPTTQSEIGIWGVAGGIYFTATRGFVDSDGITEAETEDPSLYDTYKIIELNENMFEYQNLSTGNRFIVRRDLSSGAR